MQTLAIVGALAALEDIETYYDYGKRHPSINVKVDVWPNTLPWEALRAEFGDVVDVVAAWVADLDEQTRCEHIDTAWEIARECGWDDAKTNGSDVLAGGAKVYSAGRSGGHLVVHGIGTPDEWITTECVHTLREGTCYDWDCEGFDVVDVDKVAAWCEFAQSIEAIRDGFTYQVAWHLMVNVWEPIQDDMARALGGLVTTGATR